MVIKLQEYSAEEKKYMLATARETIKKLLDGREFLMKVPEDCPERLKEKGAAFVTLEKIVGAEKQLRGCVGYLEATEPLIKNIIRNSANAAFNDSRFDPLSTEEFDKIEIEISVLTAPVPLKYSGYNDLLNKVNAPNDGVILSKGSRRATFLPSVWEHFKTDGKYYKEGFLKELCLKAGLMPNAWKEDVQIEIYHAILIKENDH
ncbi:AmmeMemoRadiSam system protein A [Candidatus Woesearchaeota archaeon]|nr:AmmeMemoRadiSam system protein A [Candidatus Woesearchaeota archaeon]